MSGERWEAGTASGRSSGADSFPAMPVRRQAALLRWAAFLTPNLSYPFVLIGVMLEPFPVFQLRGSVLIADLLFVIAAVMLAIEARSGKTRVWAPLWLVWAAATLPLIYALQAYSDADVGNYADLVYMLVIAMASILMPMVIASQRLASPAQLNLLICAWVLATVVSGLVPVLGHFGLAPSFFKPFLLVIAGRIGGFTLHPNNLGLYQAMTVPVSVALAFRSRGFRGYAFWLACAGLSIYTANLTGSRSALVISLIGATSVILMFLLFQMRGKLAARHAVTMVLCVAAAAVFLIFKGDNHTASGRLFDTNEATAVRSDHVREQMFELSAQRFWENPVTGIGYRYFTAPHNVYIGSLACGGVLGMLYFVLLAGGIAWYSLRLMRAALRGEADFASAVAFCTLFGCWLIYGFKDNTLMYRDPSVGLGLLCLLYVHQCKRWAPSNPPPLRFRR